MQELHLNSSEFFILYYPLLSVRQAPWVRQNVLHIPAWWCQWHLNSNYRWKIGQVEVKTTRFIKAWILMELELNASCGFDHISSYSSLVF